MRSIPSMQRAMTEITTKTARGPGKPWQPGQSGNPAGRPKGWPHVLAEFIKKDVLDAWNEMLPEGQTRGQKALRELSAKDFIEAASRIVPRELFLAVQAAAVCCSPVG